MNSRFVIDDQFLKSIRDYSKISLFQKEALTVLVRHLSVHELKGLNDTFLSLDEDKNGIILIQHLSDILHDSRLHLAQKEIDNLINSIDIDKNGKLNYSEFLAATISSKHNFEIELI